MKSDKSKNQRRQNVSKKIETPKSTSILSPISDKRYIASKTPKDTEYFSKDLLENTRKYLEMSNGNNNYLITPITTINDYSDKFSSPTLHEDYNISQKYNDIYDYSDYTPNYIREGLDNDNGNEKLHRVKDEYIEYLQRQLEENNKNVIRLESKLNDLQKRFKNLIDDNRLLNDTLNERNSKLNEFIQENENLRLQMNNYIDNEAKYRLQIQYCEKLVEHKLQKWERKNPAPADMFTEEVEKWKQLRETMKERFRDFVVSIYAPLIIMGNRVNVKKQRMDANKIAEVKDVDGKGHDVSFPNLSTEDKLYKNAESAAKNAMKKDASIIDADLMNHKRNQKRPLLGAKRTTLADKKLKKAA